ncbi:MAG: hypothetical protein HYX95_02325 [Chloroflexi bacterium]|nr:hypothetical protein [Chloroflexota bacterium]
MQEVGTGEKMSAMCRCRGISEPTLHRWKAKYGAFPTVDR